MPSFALTVDSQPLSGLKNIQEQARFIIHVFDFIGLNLRLPRKISMTMIRL